MADLNINLSSCYWSLGAGWVTNEETMFVGRDNNNYYRVQMTFTTGELNGGYIKLIVSAKPSSNSSPGYTTAVLTKTPVADDGIYKNNYTESDTPLVNATIATSYAYSSTAGTSYAGTDNTNRFYYIFDLTSAPLESNTTYYVYLRRGGPSGQGSSGWIQFPKSSVALTLPEASYIPQGYRLYYAADGLTTQIKYHDVPINLHPALFRDSQTELITTTLDVNCDDVELSNNVYTSSKKIEYEFTGWKALDGTVYSGGALYTKNESTEFTSQWNIGVSHGFVTLPTALERIGYTFDGWYDTPSGGIKYTHAPTESTTLYAHWTPKIYQITVDCAGGSGIPNGAYTIETDTFTFGAPTREGYNFLGWTGSNGDVPQQSITIPRGSTGDRYYVANWEVIGGISGNLAIKVSNTYISGTPYVKVGNTYVEGSAVYIKVNGQWIRT